MILKQEHMTVKYCLYFMSIKFLIEEFTMNPRLWLKMKHFKDMYMVNYTYLKMLLAKTEE